MDLHLLVLCYLEWLLAKGPQDGTTLCYFFQFFVIQRWQSSSVCCRWLSLLVLCYLEPRTATRLPGECNCDFQFFVIQSQVQQKYSMFQRCIHHFQFFVIQSICLSVVIFSRVFFQFFVIQRRYALLERKDCKKTFSSLLFRVG